MMAYPCNSCIWETEAGCYVSLRLAYSIRQIPGQLGLRGKKGQTAQLLNEYSLKPSLFLCHA